MALSDDASRVLALKSFDHLEANADAYWDVPQGQPGEFGQPEGAAQVDEERGEDGEAARMRRTICSCAAYEGVVYRDSTADGIDADMLEAGGGRDSTNDELEREHERSTVRLAFSCTLAGLWKLVALSVNRAGADGGETLKLPEGWLEQARENRRKLQMLAAAVQRQPILASSASYDARWITTGGA